MASPFDALPDAKPALHPAFDALPDAGAPSAAAAPPQVPLPEGATPVPPAPAAGPFDVIDKAAQADAARAATPISALNPPSDTGPGTHSLTRDLTSGAEGFNQSLIKLLLGPSALGHVIGSQIATKVLGQPEPFDQPAAAYKELVGKMPIQEQDMTPIEKTFHAGGETVGQLLPTVPMWAAAGATRALTPFVPETAAGWGPALRNWAEQSARYAVEQPGAALKTETVANFGAGAGGEIGKQTGTNEGLTSLMGAMGLPLYQKFLSPTGWPGQLISMLKNKVAPTVVGAMPGSVEQEARIAAQNAYANREGIYADPSLPPPDTTKLQAIQDAATKKALAANTAGVGTAVEGALADPRVAANAARSAELQQAIPGFRPTLGVATDAPSLVAKEAAVGRAAAGTDLGDLAARRAANAQAIGTYAEGAVPAVPGGADERLTKLLLGEQQAADRAAAQGPATVENQIRDATAALPERSTIETGTQIRGATDVAEGAANAEVQRLRAAIDPGGTFREPTTSLYNSIVGRLNNLGTDLTNPVIPPKVREILGNARPQVILDAQGNPAGRVAPTYDIDSLLTARQQVGQKLRQLGPVQSIEAADARSALAATRDGIDAEIERISQAPAPGPQAPVPGLPAPQERISGPQAPAAAVDPMRQAGSNFATDYLARLKSVSPEDLQNLIADAEKQVVRHARTEAESQQYRQGLTDVYRKALADAQGAPPGATPGGPDVPAVTPTARGAAPGAPLPPEQPSTIQSRLADYNRYYREQYVPRFRQDLGAELGATRASGQEVIKPEDIIPRLLGPNNASEMRQFNLIHGENPAARELVTNAALDDIRRTSVRDGMIQPDAIQKWLTAHSRVLDEAPWLRDAVGQRDPTQLYGRLAQAEGARAATADQNLAGMLGGQPHELVDAGLKDPAQMARIANQARAVGPEAEDALRRSVWDRILAAGKNPEGDLLDASKMRALLDKNDAALSMVLTPQHKEALRNILDAAQAETRVPIPRGSAELPATADTLAKKLTGQGVPAFLSKLMRVESGMTGKGYAMLDTGVRVMNQWTNAQADRAWRQALFSQPIAETLATAARQGAKITPMMKAKLRGYLTLVPGNMIDEYTRPKGEQQQEQP